MISLPCNLGFSDTFAVEIIPLAPVNLVCVLSLSIPSTSHVAMPTSAYALIRSLLVTIPFIFFQLASVDCFIKGYKHRCPQSAVLAV
jgi:hypothetical protein